MGCTYPLLISADRHEAQLLPIASKSTTSNWQYIRSEAEYLSVCDICACLFKWLIYRSLQCNTQMSST